MAVTDKSWIRTRQPPLLNVPAMILDLPMLENIDLAEPDWPTAAWHRFSLLTERVTC